MKKSISRHHKGMVKEKKDLERNKRNLVKLLFKFEIQKNSQNSFIAFSP